MDIILLKTAYNNNLAFQYRAWLDRDYATSVTKLHAASRIGTSIDATFFGTNGQFSFALCTRTCIVIQRGSFRVNHLITSGDSHGCDSFKTAIRRRVHSPTPPSCSHTCNVSKSNPMGQVRHFFSSSPCAIVYGADKVRAPKRTKADAVRGNER